MTFTATVTASTGTFDNGGTVHFAVDGCNYGTAVCLSGGSATIADATLSIGTHTITATYMGDTNFGSSSCTLIQTVNQGSTTTTVTSSANPSDFGQSVTFTAAVSVASPVPRTPTGTVTFEDGGSLLGTAQVSGDTATFTTSNLALGMQTITASYGGDTNFTGSTASGTFLETVNKASTMTTVTAAPVTYGTAVTFTATVASSPTGTTGTVTFSDGSASIGTGSVSSGQATFTTSTTYPAGTHTIKASYPPR